MAGADMVHWDIVTLGNAGPYKLSMRHSRGAISEYFMTVGAALRREQELEGLFLASSMPAPITARAS